MDAGGGKLRACRGGCGKGGPPGVAKRCIARYHAQTKNKTKKPSKADKGMCNTKTHPATGTQAVVLKVRGVTA